MEDLGLPSLLDIVTPLIPHTKLNNMPTEPINEPIMFSNSYYYDFDEMVSFLQSAKNQFTIFSFNAQSLNAKFNELVILISRLADINLRFSMICVQESWINSTMDTSLLELEEDFGYKLITAPCRLTSHCGLVVYLDTMFNYCPMPGVNSKIFEDQLFKITSEKMKKSIIVCNIYRPPVDSKENYETFTREIANVFSTLSSRQCPVVILGDYNIDLLQIRNVSMFREFFDTIISNGFIPQITFPTRIADTANGRSATLIDNILLRMCSPAVHSISGILTSKISDHFGYFMSIDLLELDSSNSDCKQKFIELVHMSAKNICNFKKSISSMNILEKLDKTPGANVDQNYAIFENCIETARKNNFPIKKVKFNKYKHGRNDWITSGILRSIRYRDKLYKKLKNIPQILCNTRFLKLT